MLPRRNPPRDRRPPAAYADFEMDQDQPLLPPPANPVSNENPEPNLIDLEDGGNDGNVQIQDQQVTNGGRTSPTPSVRSHTSRRSNASSSSIARRRDAEVELREAQRLAQLKEEIQAAKTKARIAAANAQLAAQQADILAECEFENLDSKLKTESRLSELKVALEKAKIAEDEEDSSDYYSPPPSPPATRTSIPKPRTVKNWVTNHQVTFDPELTKPKPINFDPEPQKTSPVFLPMYASTPFVPKPSATPFVPRRQEPTSTQAQHVPAYYNQQPLTPTPAQAPVQPDAHHAVLTYRKYPDLPYFGGDIKDWPLFLANYNQSTALYGIPPIYNITRLQKALKGEAKTAVHALLMHESNLPRIIEALEMQFGRSEEIVEKMINEVKKLSPIRERQYRELLQFSNHVSNMIAMISSLNRPDYFTNTLLLKEITNKLPTTLHMEWGKQLFNVGVPSLDQFEAWLKVKAKEIMPLASSCSSQAVKSEDQKQKPRAPKAVHINAEIEFSDHEQNNPKPPKPENKQAEGESKPEKPKEPFCGYCKTHGHKTGKCPKMKGDTLEQRVATVKANRLCYRCLGYGHSSKKCKVKIKCEEPDCGKRHHTLMHGSQPSTQVATTSDPTLSEENLRSEIERNAIFLNRSFVASQIVPVNLIHGKNKVKVYAFLDTGSDYTLLDESVAKQLKITGPSEPLAFKTLAGDSFLPSQKLQVKIENIGSGEIYDMAEVRTHPRLDIRSGSVSRKLIDKWSHLKNLKDIVTFENEKPLMLIGLPHAHLINPVYSVRPDKNGPIAAQTPLGWVIFGKMCLPDSTTEIPRSYFIQSSQVLHASIDETKLQLANPDLSLHKLVEGFFENETLGIEPRSKEDASPEIRRALEIANSTFNRVGDRYEIGLLWKDDSPKFPDNYKDALNRLKSQERKMDKDPVYAKRYAENMQAYIDKGYLRKLTPEEAAVTSPKTWYLPHFSVVNPQKPDKLRMVFDAAAKTEGVSFNSKVLPGPDILKPLPGILCQFRERRIGLAADIREMFHQILIRPQDQDAQRILWRGMDRKRNPDVYVMRAMTFGSTSSPFCAQFVKNTHAEKYREQYPEAVEAIINSHYVDDLLKSVEPGDEFKMHGDVTKVHSLGGFVICNWSSNSAELIKSIPVDMRSKSLKTFTGKEEMESEKVLGLVWNPQLDTFKFNTKFAKIPSSIVSGEEVPTKRQVLATVMSVFDPLGFSANVAIKAKLLIQKCWKLGIGWDDRIPESLFEHWKQWLDLVHQIEKFSLPRCYSSAFSTALEIQLHVFCDGSDQAYGTVAYFRINNGFGIETTLVSAKSKVLPIKQKFKENVSVPRAELQAEVLGTRLAISIVEWHSIKPERIVFWTDNTTVLYWLNMDHSRLKQFVSNRVAEIQDSTTPDQWKYVPTDLNVADDVTKGHLPVSFDPDSRWIRGPEFLQLDEEEWPKMPSTAKPDEAVVQAELKKLVIKEGEDSRNLVIEFEKFSSLTRLVRVMAHVMRFIDPKKKIHKFLTTDELHSALIKLIKLSQAEAYAELSRCEDPTSFEKFKKSSKLSQLSLYIDQDGIIRMKGRIQHHVFGAQVEANPFLLHPHHSLTKLIIKDQHERFLHQGREAVVNAIKAKCCIPALREAVKKIIRDCQFCKIRRAVPKPPEMAPLPPCRTATFSRPFTHTGVDYFGPMIVTIGRRNEKRWGSLFTCMTTRAVHVELAVDLSSDGFINCLRRFIADRACPLKMYSDNGTNFVGAEAELKAEVQKLIREEEAIQNFVCKYGMTWEFIPPQAPHMGGCWERMVRATKDCLAVSLKEVRPKEDTLRTFLKEAQAIVNSHPLTYVSSDLEADEVLTPNHFLFGTATIVHPPGVFEPNDMKRAKQWRIAQTLADHFWKRWIKEVLPILNPRTKWLKQQEALKVDDIVIVVDDQFPRNSWPKGRILEVFPGKDGQTRKALVKIGDGKFLRPTTKLIVLDVHRKEE